MGANLFGWQPRKEGWLICPKIQQRNPFQQIDTYMPSTEEKKKSIIGRYFRPVLSIGLIGLLITWIDTDTLIDTLGNADLYYLGSAFSLMIISRLLMPIKWNILLRSQNQNIKWKEAIKIYYVSSFFGIFLPATVGGDVLRSFYTQKNGIELKDTLASIIVERLVGAITTAGLGIFGGVVFILYFSKVETDLHTVIYGASILLIAFTLIFYFSLTTPFSKFVSNVSGRIAKYKKTKKLSEKLLELYQSYFLYKEQKKTLLLFTLLTFVESVLPALWSWLLALSIGITSVDFIYYCAFVPIVLLMTRLPITIDGFGLNEGAYVYFLSIVGISATQGFLVGIISHILFLISMSPGAVIYLLNDNTFSRKKKSTIEKTTDT